MKKCIAMLLTLTLILGLLSGCSGTTVVYYSDCTCDANSHTPPATQPQAPVTSDGTPVKTGLAIVTSVSDSVPAGEKDGKIAYDVTLVAVTVDDNGVIDSCVIDSLPANVTFDTAGQITCDLTAAIRTKDEQGEDYGMKAYAGSKYEWNEQAAALAAYAEGKTVAELISGAVGEDGKAVDADLAATASIYLGGYVSAIEAAVASAQHLGAVKGDTLKLACIPGIKSSVSAGEKDGTAQLDADVTALTMNGDVITSCIIDSLQAKINFNAAGEITSDLTAAILTKNGLGENYGMKAWGGAKYEWNEQAAAFASYVTGKTAAEVAGIAVTEGKPSDADLASSVTIAIGDFQGLIAKALGE